MFIDNVLCTMLVHWNIIDLSESSVETLALWGKQAEAFRPKLKEGKLEDVPSHVDGPSVTAREAYVVRSAAIEAGKRILEHARKISKEEGLEWLAEVSEADIGRSLWSSDWVWCAMLTGDISTFTSIRRLHLGRGQGRRGTTKGSQDGREGYDHVLSGSSLAACRRRVGSRLEMKDGCSVKVAWQLDRRYDPN
jgi:hypothetical protein